MANETRSKTPSNPPWILRLLLKALLNPTENLEFTDDLNEVYKAVADSEGLTKARIWSGLRVLESLPSLMSDLI